MLLPPAPSVPEPPPFPDFVKLDEERKLNNIKSNFPFIERSFRCLFIQEKKISDLISLLTSNNLGKEPQQKLTSLIQIRSKVKWWKREKRK